MSVHLQTGMRANSQKIIMCLNVFRPVHHTLSPSGSAGECIGFEFDGRVGVFKGLETRKGGGVIVFPDVSFDVFLQHAQMLKQHVHLRIGLDDHVTARR